MAVWSYAMVSVAFVSLLSLLGVLVLVLRRDLLHRITLYLVSFAVGGLFGDALIHLIPESLKQTGEGLGTSLYVLAGVIGFFVLEKLLVWRHVHVHRDVHGGEQGVKAVVPLILLGDMVHNFIDGAVIGASYTVSIPLGVSTTLAVVAHEIPHEFGNFGVLVHGGLTPRRALLLNFLTALTAIAGSVASLLVGPRVEGYAGAVVPLTAGGFLYIAGTDLMPELQSEARLLQSFVQLLCILGGVGAMALLRVIG